jgi:hypothetical protein
MDERPCAGLASADDPSPAWSDGRWLLLLFVLVVPVRAWLLYNTEVAARDSIGYIRYALQFEEKPWGDVVRSFDQHPGYPMAIWLVSLPVRAVAGTTPDVMVLCGQLVSALAAVLLVLPTFYLGKTLWNAPVGFGGALLLQWLPVSGQHLSDGLSESLFLLFVASALLFAAWGLERLGLTHLALSGTFAGLAYLTRPEGVLTLLAAGAVLLGMQLCAARRHPWRMWTAGALALAAPAVALGALYVITIGGLSNKQSVKTVIETVAQTPALNGPPAQRGLFANLFGATYRPVAAPLGRLGLSLRALGSELLYALHYVGPALAVIPLLIHRRALFARTGAWLAVCYIAMHTAALVLLAMSAHYVSDRHVVPLAMLLGYLAALGVYELVSRLLQARTKMAPGRRSHAGVVVLLSLVAVACLPRTLQRLHGNRAGNHAAGLWVAAQWQPGDMVDDDHNWSHYYAGQVFLEHRDPPAPPDYQPKSFVVMTRSRDPEVAMERQKKERILSKRGRLVYHWPPERSAAEARVVVYAVPRDPRAYPWKVAPLPVSIQDDH